MGYLHLLKLLKKNVWNEFYILVKIFLQVIYVFLNLKLNKNLRLGK